MVIDTSVIVAIFEDEVERLSFLRGLEADHPARLNFGDFMTYALAKQTGEPLLFKGDDFNKTDLPLVETL